MATLFCNCCLLLVGFLIIISNGVIDAKITQSKNPIEFIHKSIYRNINNKRSLSVKLRQSCSSILDNYPRECNVTLLAGNISSVPSVNDLATLNNAYSQFCVPKCTDPLINYYRCTYTGDLLTYLINLLEHGVCGKHNNDFCEVLYLRRYANNRNFINVLINACPFTNSGVHCARASSTCKQYVSNFNTNMGCCTSPYLGSDVSSCGINVANPCQSAIPSLLPPTVPGSGGPTVPGSGGPTIPGSGGPTVPGSGGTVATPTPSSYCIIVPTMLTLLIAVFFTFFI